MKDDKRERDVPSGSKASREKRADHPLLQFHRTMREFRGGISELKQVAERLGRTTEKPILQSVAKSVGRGRQENSSTPAHLTMSRRTSPNMPFYRAAPGQESPYSSRRMRNVHTAEDREAVKHLTEGSSSGTFEDLPRAARVAMILRADELIKSEGRRSRVVESLAAAVRSGRPEIAANFNPRKLERVLGGLLGGKQNALRSLWSPEVAGMVERYHFERKVIQERLGGLERVVAEEGHESPAAAAELAVPSAEHAGVSSESTGQAPPSRTDSRTVENLFRRNDLLHLRGQAENRRQHLVGQGAARSERTLPAMSNEPARGEIPLPAEGSPPRRSAGVPTQLTEGAKSSNGRRKLEGKLTFVAQNGETLGMAELSGSDYDG
jgi:hypothetical protein